MGLVFPDRTGLLASNPERPRPATPPCAPTRPARCMSGFWIRQVTYGFACLCFWRDVEASFFRCLGKYGDLLFTGRIVLLAPNLDRLRLAVPPGAPTRPARSTSGFWVRQVGLDSFFLGHVPGHALHEKCLQRQKGVVPQVGSEKKERFSF